MSARSAQAAPAALGTPGNSSSTITDEHAHLESRGRRWALRDKARRFVDGTDVPVFATDENGSVVYGADGQPVIRTYRAAGDKYLACGVRRQDANVGVPVKWDGPGTRAGLGNLQSCGSVWACPVCAAQIQRERAEEMRRVLDWARGLGHTIVMVTLTVQHYQRHELAELWDAVSAGWAGVTSGSSWQSEKPEKFAAREDAWDERYQTAREWGARMPKNGPAYAVAMTYADDEPSYAAALRPQRRIGDQERFGVVGWSRVVEVTVGSHGWHPHVHAVLVLSGDRDTAAANAVELGERMFTRWRAALGREGFTSERYAGGYHLLLGPAAEQAIGEYMTKDQGSDAPQLTDWADVVSREALLGSWKTGRRKGKTPFQLLALIDYDRLPAQSPRMEAQWREFVAASEGRRQQTWSAGLRELAGLAEAARTDEEIAADDRAGTVRLTLTPETWDDVAGVATTILDVVEVEGVEGLRALLDRCGWSYTLPPTTAQDEWFVPDE